MKTDSSCVSIEEVFSNINKYVLPDCQDACTDLWAKNIFTSKYSGQNNPVLRFILIRNLSPENLKIFHKLINRYPMNYYKDGDLYGIRARTKAGNVKEVLSGLTIPLEMQDVLEGYVTVEQFLMDRYGLKKKVPNPEFIKDLKAPDIDEYADKYGFMEAQKKYYYNSKQPEFLESFDESKRTKSNEEYIQEAGLSSLDDPERGVIYNSEFFKAAHQRYLEYQKRKNATSKSEKGIKAASSRDEER